MIIAAKVLLQQSFPLLYDNEGILRLTSEYDVRSPQVSSGDGKGMRELREFGWADISILRFDGNSC